MEFCLQQGNWSREQMAISAGARRLGIPVLGVPAKECPPGCIPIGSVEFCERVSGTGGGFKDFYPDFLGLWFKRQIISRFAVKNGVVGSKPLFFKYAAEWKSDLYPSRVLSPGEMVPCVCCYLSEVVRFVDEWRYYVADGCVVDAGWYQGENEDAVAPELGIEWPEGFSGAVDFGRLDTGEIALVEAHAPFACGWYGDNHENFALWQAVAWEHMDYWFPDRYKGRIAAELSFSF